MPTEYEYTVRGWGQFPDDMLRYDQARVVSIADDGPHHKIYTIRGKVKPTIGRWQSFLYGVSSSVRRVTS